MKNTPNILRIENNNVVTCEPPKHITIPDGVTSIGDNAFWECRNLTSIKLPKKFQSPAERRRIGLLSKVRLTH